VLLTQTCFFLLQLHRPLEVMSDNTRYEVAGANVAIGRGLSLPYRLASDPDVHGWVCTRHPEECRADDNSYPVAIYPPGYSLFIAAIYTVCGRSLLALVVAQLLLLWLVFILFERVAARLLDGVGYTFAMTIAASYPFIARQATMIMSDHLHVVLYVAAFAALLLRRPGVMRGALVGTLMGAAALVRPYSLFVLPVILLWPGIWSGMRAAWRERLVAAVLFLLPFGVWTARNAYQFGHFIPVTTNGVGLTLLHTTIEFDGSNYDDSEQRFYGDLVARYGDDGMTYSHSRQMGREAMAKIRARPGKMIERMLIHVPKLWISLGTSGGGKSRVWPLLVLYLGGLWLLGLIGMWLVRRDPVWQPVILGVVVYWMTLVPLPGEARRTLPLRLLHLWLAAAAVSWAWRRWRNRAATP
jgi:4-amino-4-deoxy-L-arabinose transferase-like glycosyltransferase